MGTASCSGTTKLFFFITLLSTASSLCYWPNGAVYYSPDHTECPNTPACCALNRSNPPAGNHSFGEARDDCLSNGLCQNRVTETDGTLTQTYWLVACKYYDWTGNCLDICGGQLTPVTPCDGTNTSTTWCCGATNACCANETEVHTIAPTFIAAETPPASASPQSVASITAQPSSVSSNVPQSSTPSASSTTAPASPHGGLSSGAKAGIAIGAIAGALVLFGAGFFVAKSLRWKKKAEIATRGQPAEQDDTASKTPYPPPAWAPPEMGGAEYFEAGSAPRYEVNGVTYVEAGGVPYYEAGNMTYREADGFPISGYGNR